MNSNILEVTQIAETLLSECNVPETPNVAIRELADLELVCVGGGSGDVIF